MSDAMADIMAADDAIDDLPEIGVMDLYVRAKLMRAAMNKYRDNPEGWDCEMFQSTKNALMHYSKDGVRTHVAGDIDATPWAREIAANTRSEDFIVGVFGRITNDEWSREKCINVARDYLKDYLKGSCGMPDDKVIRENLKNYDGE